MSLDRGLDRPMLNDYRMMTSLDQQPPSGDYHDSIMSELLSNTRSITEEIHSRNIAKDVDDHYKSEWRMVALVLDRILLILFFLMTLFTCIVIFINVPYWGDEESAVH